MGFLADVGRANVLGQVMEYGKFAQQTQTEQLKQQALKMKMAEAEQNSRPMLLSELIGKGSESKPNTMKLFQDAAIASGLKKVPLPEGGEDYIITKNDLPTIQKQMELNQKLHPQLLFAEYNDLRLELDAIDKQRGKGTPQEELARASRQEEIKKRRAELLFEIHKGKPPTAEEETAKAPTVKEFDEGNEKVTRQWNQDTKKWDEVARGPRYKPGDTTGGEKRAKDSELRQILKESYGLSDFIVTAADQQVRQKFTVALAFAAEIARNPEGFGLAKDAGAGEIAKKAKEMEQSSSGEEVPTPVPIERFDPRKR